MNWRSRRGGWAFGQIADMQIWWNSLQGTLKGAHVDVTGYSLGDHLATAFRQMHWDQIGKVYTFNGAGVDTVDPSVGLTNLIDRFKGWRSNGNADLFTDSRGQTKYQELFARYSKNSNVTTAAAANRCDLNDFGDTRSIVLTSGMAANDGAYRRAA